MFLPYLIPIESDAIHKLVNIGGEILTKEKKSWYLQVIGKLIHLCYMQLNIVFLVHKLVQYSFHPYLVQKSVFQKIFRYIKYTIIFNI